MHSRRLCPAWRRPFFAFAIQRQSGSPPECFRIIDGYIRCPTVPKTYITTRISDILSEYAALTISWTFSSGPSRRLRSRSCIENHPFPLLRCPRRPGWDPSWTGMKYGGDPIHMLNFIPHMTKKLLSVEERDWLPKLWGAIDDAYLTNTSKSINDYWEVEVIVERPPQWHDNRDKTSSGIYVAPPAALLSERVQSTHSYLNSSSSPQSTVKQKSRGSTTGDVQPSGPPMEILDGPLSSIRFMNSRGRQ
ncbi:hypothetical protein B0H14DRAFT_1008236 [Mycena olivaceomarginata]|nr:hypothetical protein B0H14DRAFT_1008236 [Mycena olivaceomarginata]